MYIFYAVSAYRNLFFLLMHKGSFGKKNKSKCYILVIYKFTCFILLSSEIQSMVLRYQLSCAFVGDKSSWLISFFL